MEWNFTIHWSLHSSRDSHNPYVSKPPSTNQNGSISEIKFLVEQRFCSSFRHKITEPNSRLDCVRSIFKALLDLTVTINQNCYDALRVMKILIRSR